jgi:hypothetical protein
MLIIPYLNELCAIRNHILRVGHIGCWQACQNVAHRLDRFSGKVRAESIKKIY